MSAADGWSPGGWLAAHGRRARKGLGQNFLADRAVAERIAAQALAEGGGTVLEIGSGLGALTAPLLARAARVVALERDAALVAALQERFAGRDGLEVVAGDALRQDWASLLASGPAPRVIAGNLPYHITAPVLERTLAQADRITRAVFMVQREVAERLRAPPGSRTYGATSVLLQARFEVRLVLVVRPGAFVPPPKIDSAVIVLSPWPSPRAQLDDVFRSVVRSAFGERRKMLRNCWRGLGGWTPSELAANAAAAGIELDARAETLGVEAFARLAERVRGAPKPNG